MPYVPWQFLELRKPGIIALSGTRMATLGSEYILTMAQELEKVIGYSATKGLLYRIFKEGAEERMRKMDFYKGLDPDQIFLSQAVPLMIELGWITGATIKHASNKVYVEVSDSVFRGDEQGATNPRCHALAGVLAANWSRFTGKDYDCSEVACSAMNEENCTFQLTPSPASKLHVEVRE